MKKTLLSKNALRSLFWCFALLLLNTHMSWGKSAIAGTNGLAINGTVSEITLIPDRNFEQALIDLLLDSGPIDGQVLTSNISGVTFLDVHLKNISDLTGIQDFVGLETLNCSANNLSSLDLTGLNALKNLQCFENRLVTLTLTGLTNLEILDCNTNLLSSLDISSLTKLADFDCYLNSLTSLDVSKATLLEYMDCGDNMITSLDVTGLTALNYLFVGYNNLSTLNLTDLMTSAEMRCYNNSPLNCIIADDPAAAALNGNWLKDGFSAYSKSNPTDQTGNVTGGTSVCMGSSSGLLTLNDAVGTIARWESAVSPFTTWSSISNTSNTYTSGVLMETTRFRVVTESNCQTYASTPATVTIENTTWTGTWSNGTPTAIKSAIISAAFTANADLTACSLIVNNNAVVTIPTGFSVTLNGALTVSSGSFTLENNANLIQSTNVANSGNITVKRNSALQVRLDHTLWSSPVTGAQTLAGFSPNTLVNRFYNFDTATNKYAATVSTGTFTAGKGVAVRAPNDYTTTPTTFNGVFTGVPNNGPIPVALNTTVPGNNLVGNPYPSTIDAAAFVNVANNPNIGGTLYFYAHTLSMDANGIFPTGTNYAVWTSGSGGTAATLGTSGVPANVPNGIIQAGQGFFVKATGAGNVNFTNTMRVNNTANQFFKTSSTKTEAIERHRIWLNLTNGAGTEFNQILVAYAAGATQDVDRDYDGLAFGNTGSALSSKIAGEDYTIQGRALPFTPDDVVALGFKAAADGNYSISLSNMDGLFLDTQEIFIKDNTTGKTQSLKGTPYTFTSTAGVHDTRFELLYSKTLGVSEPTFDKTGVVVYKKEGVFYVNSNGINIKEISVFDMRGRLIGKQSNINSNTSTLRGLSSTVGVLLLKIVSDKNETVTIKVIN